MEAYNLNLINQSNDQKVSTNTPNNFFNALENVSTKDTIKTDNISNNYSIKNETSNFQELLQKRKEQESKCNKTKCKVVIKVQNSF